MNYPFAQINTAVPSEISRIFKLCEEIGWAPEHVLEIYSKSLIPLLDDETINTLHAFSHSGGVGKRNGI